MEATDNLVNESGKRFAILLVKTRIEKLLSDNKYASINEFFSSNPDLNTFLVAQRLDNIIKNQGYNITNEDYKHIIQQLLNKELNKQMEDNDLKNKIIYSNDDSNKQNRNNAVTYLNEEEQAINKFIISNEILENPQTPSKQKVLLAKKTSNGNSGFMDALLLAFIVGAFLGTVFINLYAKILQII